jgi:hypothetical protein
MYAWAVVNRRRSRATQMIVNSIEYQEFANQYLANEDLLYYEPESDHVQTIYQQYMMKGDRMQIQDHYAL